MRFGLSLAPQRRVFAAFALYSFCMGNIFPRLPDIQHQICLMLPQAAKKFLGRSFVGAQRINFSHGTSFPSY